HLRHLHPDAGIAGVERLDDGDRGELPEPLHERIPVRLVRQGAVGAFSVLGQVGRVLDASGHGGRLPWTAVHTFDLPGLAADAGAEHAADVPLAGLTTLLLGGPAAHLLTCRDTPALVRVMRSLDAEGSRTLVLGGGSNLVIADEGFDGVAVRVATSEVTV